MRADDLLCCVQDLCERLFVVGEGLRGFPCHLGVRWAPNSSQMGVAQYFLNFFVAEVMGPTLDLGLMHQVLVGVGKRRL